jgi:general secretion pathway protein D
MDLPTNIQRLVEIADLIDVQVFAGTRMEIYQPKVASAEELATEMTKVMQAYASSVPQPENFTAQFLALPRINQLMVISHSEAAWTYAKRWLDRIDVIAEGPGRRIFVYPVENGKAEELANVLSAALGLPAPAGGGQRRTLEELHRSTPGGTGQFGGGSQFGGSRSGTSGTSGFGSSGFGSQQPFGAYAAAQVPAPAGQPAAPAPQPTPGLAPLPPGTAPRAPTPGAPGAPTAKPEEQLRIVADPATNSLIVYGTAQEFQNIKNILKELDAVPRQVLLDVLVFEVTLSNTERLGVDYEIKSGNTPFLNFTFPSRGSVLTGLVNLLGQANSSGTTQPFGGMTGIFGGNTVRALVNALMADSRVKVLSAPSVLASDNRPARIQVGSQQPVATGSVSTPITTTGTGTATSFATSSTIQYQNTGRIVTIIPQVNSQGLVNLQCLVEVSAINTTVQGTVQLGTAGSFPSFDIRQAETTAVVQDGDSLAIGGIIAENKNETRQGIPYLMNIPVLGQLFRTTTDTTDRTELIFLITPHVIRNRSEGTAVTEEFKSKLSSLRNELERMRLNRELDLEKMKREWQDQQQLKQQQQPAAPVPPTEPPSPAPSPSSSPAPSAPSVTPLRNINVVPGELPRTGPSQDPQASIGADASSLSASRVLPAQTGTVRDRVAEPAPRKEIPSALSVATLKEPPRVTPSVTNSAREPSRRGAIWTVQVASLNQTRDAEGIADKLKVKGYDSYVVAAEVKSKIWHRVRVGQGVDLSEAFELRMKLKSKENFDQAFIALR